MRFAPALAALMLLAAGCGGGGGRPVPPFADGSSGITVSITVKDTHGDPVAGAAVQLSLLAGTTDGVGTCRFALQSPGNYNLSAQGAAGVFAARRITVPEGGAKIELILNPAPAAFTVVGVEPELNSDLAPLRQPLIIRFSRDVDAASLSAPCFTFTPGLAEYELTVQGAEVRIVPLCELKTGQRYRLKIGGVHSVDGAVMPEEAYTFFTTKPVDDEPPVLLRSVPAAGATNVLRNQSLEFVFSDSIAPLAGGFQLTFTPEAPAGEVTAQANVLRYLPGSLLEANTDYTVTVGTLSDLAGNLSAPTSVRFRTGATVAVHDDIEPSWNVLAGAIVFARRTGSQYDLFTVSPDGTGLTRLTETPGNERHPAYSADGRLITYQSDYAGNWDIFVMNAATRQATQVTFLPENETAPAFSGTFSQLIAYERREGTPERARIYLMNADGSYNRRADESTSRDEWSPAFHPLLDNQLLFLASDGGDTDIFSKSAFLEGGTPVNANLTEPLTDSQFEAAWAPDGSAIAFLSDQGGQRNIWVMDPSGATHYQVTHLPEPVHSLAYSPVAGDDRVVAAVGAAGTRSLYVISLVSGVVERRLTE